MALSLVLSCFKCAKITRKTFNGYMHEDLKISQCRETVQQFKKNGFSDLLNIFARREFCAETGTA